MSQINLFSQVHLDAVKKQLPTLDLQRNSSSYDIAVASNQVVFYDLTDSPFCRMVSYNIAHLSYLNAKRYGLPRIFFGG